MKKGLFAPYTKQQAIVIIRKYFGISATKAEDEVERLAACVVRDGLNANKYLYLWETKVKQNQKGDIQELYVLYPFYATPVNSVQTKQQNSNRSILISSFRKVYPEKEIIVINCHIQNNKGIIEASFPDGVYYFVVTENSVSSSYNSLKEAKNSMGM